MATSWEVAKTYSNLFLRSLQRALREEAERDLVAGGRSQAAPRPLQLELPPPPRGSA